MGKEMVASDIITKQISYAISGKMQVRLLLTQLISQYYSIF